MKLCDMGFARFVAGLMSERMGRGEDTWGYRHDGLLDIAVIML